MVGDMVREQACTVRSVVGKRVRKAWFVEAGIGIFSEHTLVVDEGDMVGRGCILV